MDKMKVLIAEYAVGTGEYEEILREGRAMLNTLVESFIKIGCEVVYPVFEDFGRFIEREGKKCDAGIVIAPDELLYEYTKILEENTENLGCPSKSVRICVDKLRTSEILKENGIPVPEILKFPTSRKKYVMKPRYGCASENIFVLSEFLSKDGYITTEFIDGEDLSASIIIGKKTLPLTINKQLIERNSRIEYVGGVVPYETPSKDDIMKIAINAAKILGCRGYVGIDFVSRYVVDVNPRPTTSIIGINRVMEEEIADLILRARFGDLPDSVKIRGTYSFRKEDL
ncbi:MAG: ATP-grasp domain-containing protein [Candidatus Syntropharchaeia archaeon]